MTPCEICGRPVRDYVPQYCCHHRDCACMGLPTEPCTCSKECNRAVFDFIGKPMDERRRLACIERYCPKSPEELLAAAKAAHTGMTCCVTNMLRNRDKFGCQELAKHLAEMKTRWLAGDEDVVAEFFALYRIE